MYNIKAQESKCSFNNVLTKNFIPDPTIMTTLLTEKRDKSTICIPSHTLFSQIYCIPSYQRIMYFISPMERSRLYRFSRGTCCLVGQSTKVWNRHLEGMAAFWIFGKTHRLKTMIKNVASKNIGFTPNLAKNRPRKSFFPYISRTTRNIEKSPKQKL